MYQRRAVKITCISLKYSRNQNSVTLHTQNTFKKNQLIIFNVEYISSHKNIVRNTTTLIFSITIHCALKTHAGHWPKREDFVFIQIFHFLLRKKNCFFFFWGKNKKFPKKYYHFFYFLCVYLKKWNIKKMWGWKSS